MHRKPTVRERTLYHFDNLMARGTVAKVGMLFIATIAFITIIGLVSSLFADNGSSAPWGVWRALVHTLSSGALGSLQGNAIYLCLMLIATLYGLFFMAILIGLINDAIKRKMEEISRGGNSILETGHIVVLGYDEMTFILIQELIMASMDHRSKVCLVILGDCEKSVMENAFRISFQKRVGHRNARVIFRTGNSSDFDALTRCSIQNARSIIVNKQEDFETIKSVMACTHLLNNCDEPGDAYVVAAIKDTRNEQAAMIAGCDTKDNDRLELLTLQAVMARIMVHTTRQPGLAKVFTELFSYQGSEIYIQKSNPDLSQLIGLPISDINKHLPSAVAIGVADNAGKVTIGPPNKVIFEKGCSLITIQAENPLVVRSSPYSTKPVAIPTPPPDEEHRVLVLGASSMLQIVIDEFANYLPVGSVVDTAEHVGNPPEQRPAEIAPGQHNSIGVIRHQVQLNDKSEVFKLLDVCKPDNVLLLSNHGAGSLNDADEDTMKLLLLLREYRIERNLNFSITCEINLSQNQELAASTSADDFIVGSHITALLMTQIAHAREMRDVFQYLLSSEGFEIYLKQAASYVPVDEPLDLFSVGEAVAKKDEILIGIRQDSTSGFRDPLVNPPKFEADGATVCQYTFSTNDHFIVLAESM